MFRTSNSPTVVVAALLALAVGGFVAAPAGAAVPPAHENADALLGAGLARGASPLIRDEARGYAPPVDEARGYQPVVEEARGLGPRHLDIAMGGHSRHLIRRLGDDRRPADDTAGAGRALTPLAV